MPWDQSSFLLDLPEKWNLSFAIEYKPHIVGYIIGSRAADMRAKVNKIVVDREYRRQGFGKQLMTRFEEECSRYGIYEVELKALVENRLANDFYAELGYQPLGSVEGTDAKTRNIYYKRLG
jgi:ribosomal protein S18 acetylase RimI-like enzyme